MTFDDAVLTAYIDGELGPIEQKRIEQAMIVDPVLADRVATIAAFGDRLSDAFRPIVQAPVPARLSEILAGKVVSIRPAHVSRHWRDGLALAASLLLGVALGMHLTGKEQGPLVVRDGMLVATGPVADALDTQLASAPGDIGILLSFRSAGRYCRVFASPAIDGIACHYGTTWQVRRTFPGRTGPGTDYRQATSADAALMATAQNMMDGMPLDAAGEQRARAANWR